MKGNTKNMHKTWILLAFTFVPAFGQISGSAQVPGAFATEHSPTSPRIGDGLKANANSLKTNNVAALIAPGTVSSSGIIVGPAREQKIAGRNLYRWSLAAVIAGNAADAASSWKLHEQNPVVAGGGSQFGLTSIAIKSGFVASSLLVQHVVLRHRPDLYKKLAWVNFATGGVFAGVARYNMSLR